MKQIGLWRCPFKGSYRAGSEFVFAIILTAAQCLAHADPARSDEISVEPAASAAAQDGSADGPQTSDAAPQQEPPNPFHDARDLIYYPGDTERIKPLGTKLFLNLMLDQKEIWSSPFHLNRHSAVWWALFGAGTAALIATDHRSINTFENSPTQLAWGRHVSNIGASYTLIPLAADFTDSAPFGTIPKRARRACSVRKL